MNTNTPFVFIFSSERSGSNLLSSIIGNHSTCSFCSPTHLFRLLYLQSEKYDDSAKLHEDTKAIFDVKLGVWNGNVKEFSGESIGEVLTNLYHSDSNKTAIIKELHPWRYLKKVNCDFPKSKIIYLVRDPRDVFISISSLPNLQTEAKEFGSVWRLEQKKSLKVFDDLGVDYVLVKYEELLRNPLDELVRITNYLEIEMENGMLDYYSSLTTKNQAKQLTAWGNIDKPLLSNNFNKFYRYLTVRQVREIEEITADELVKFGYEKADIQHFVKNPLPIKVCTYSDKELLHREEREKVISRIFSVI